MFKPFLSFVFVLSLCSVLFSACGKKEYKTNIELLHELSSNNKLPKSDKYAEIDAMAATYFAENKGESANLITFLEYFSKNASLSPNVTSVLPGSSVEFNLYKAMSIPSGNKEGESQWESDYRKKITKQNHWESIAPSTLETVFYHLVHQGQWKTMKIGNLPNRIERFNAYFEKELSESELAFFNTAWADDLANHAAKEVEIKAQYDAALACVQTEFEAFSKRNHGKLTKIKALYQKTFADPDKASVRLMRHEYEKGLISNAVAVGEEIALMGDEAGNGMQAYADQLFRMMSTIPNCGFYPVKDSRLQSFVNAREKYWKLYDMYAAVQEDLYNSLETEGCRIEGMEAIPHFPKAKNKDFDLAVFTNMLFYCGK